MIRIRTPRIPRGLLLACSLSLLMMVLSYLQLAGAAGSSAFDHAAFHAVFERPILGTSLAGHIAWFLVWLTLLHLLLGVACWLLAHATLLAFPRLKEGVRNLTAAWFVGAAIWLLVWNSGAYPRTSLGKMYAGAAGAKLFGVSAYQWLTTFFLLAVFVVLVRAAWRLASTLPRRKLLIGANSFAVVAALLAALTFWPARVLPETPAGQPNIIFLGIDSLRFDEVLRGGDSNTPHVDAFLSEALRFNNAMTPLARTYPSWVALLTGKHPHTTGAFLNLLPEDQVKLGQTLPQRLRKHGYRTVYSIDEVRFSNIDESYGFDQAITPPIGSSDFIVGTMSDTPLLNLVGATRIGKWFFPHSYANRGTAPVYEPETFVERIRDDVEFSSPMFFTAHMTLPHWPYGWRAPDQKSENLDGRRPAVYQSAVRRADQQFGEILNILEKRGLLRNAIVVAFSDHGESFSPGLEPMVPLADPLLAKLQATPFWGHGTSVLSPHQFRIFLAMRAYGPARQLLAQASGTTEVAATIEDIAPTMLDLLKIEADSAQDGISLLPTLRGTSQEARLTRRVRFTETEFNPRNLFDMTGDVMAVNAKSLVEVTNYYRVDPDTDRIEMKRKFLDVLRRNRQFAAVGWSKMLGAFPSPSTDVYSFLVVALEGGGAPHPVGSVEELAGDPETAILWSEMCARFGSIFDTGKQAIKCGTQPAATAHAGH